MGFFSFKSRSLLQFSAFFHFPDLGLRAQAPFCVSEPDNLLVVV